MLFLREATDEDMDLLFSWANDPEVRRQSFNQSPISYETHQKWFGRIMEDASIRQLILMNDLIPVGQVRLNINGEKAEISYSVSQEFRQQGFGSAIVKTIIAWARNNLPTVDKLIARVKPDNLASRKVFERQGFISEYIFYSYDLNEGYRE